MALRTDLADLVWTNPDVREQFFTLYPNSSALPPRPPTGLEDRFAAQHVFPYDDALAAWASGDMRYFGVVPRKKPINDRVELIDHYWCLWVDFDDPHGLDAVTRELSPLDFWPSAIVSTGHRGYHLYFRLEISLPLSLIEVYNRALAQLVGGDVNSPPMPSTRLRIPGTVHERSGGTARLVEMPGTAYGEDALRRLDAGLVPAVEPLMRRLQRRRLVAERKVDAALRMQERATQRNQRVSEISEKLDRRQKRLAEVREKLDRRARELDVRAREVGLPRDTGSGRRPR